MFSSREYCGLDGTHPHYHGKLAGAPALHPQLLIIEITNWEGIMDKNMHLQMSFICNILLSVIFRDEQVETPRTCRMNFPLPYCYIFPSLKGPIGSPCSFLRTLLPIPYFYLIPISKFSLYPTPGLLYLGKLWPRGPVFLVEQAQLHSGEPARNWDEFCRLQDDGSDINYMPTCSTSS